MGWIVFDSKPSIDDAPATCQYGSCSDHPIETVRYYNPREYVCYCATHAALCEAERKRAKNRLRLR
jgi:hypothetical protein